MGDHRKNVNNLKRIALFLIMVISISGCAQQDSEPYTGGSGRTDSLLVDGLERTYLTHVPSSYDGVTPVPLVIALHGGGGSAQRMANLTGFDSLSEKEGFIVVYPEGIENHWNDGREVEEYRAQRENIDDVKFISALIDHLTDDLNIDETRIYATGISNGAMMSCRLACELSEKIAAIAMVAGAMPEGFKRAGECSPQNPVSVLVINGTEDPLILWEGGEIQAGQQKLGKTLSVPETVQYWVVHNGCALVDTTWLPDGDFEDGTRVFREVYRNDRGCEVILYSIEGGGHTWPGGPQYSSERSIGKTCYDINASEVIWQFFTEHVQMAG